MKTLGHTRKASTLFFGIVFMIAASVNETGAQVVAIGHITAEVVESVSASSKMLLNLNLESVKNGDITIKTTPSNMNTRKVYMGEMVLNSGQGIACNVMIKPATLTNENGNQFVIEPTTTCCGQLETNRADGSQNLKLTGKAMLDQDQANGVYQGSYTMVFAYN